MNKTPQNQDADLAATSDEETADASVGDQIAAFGDPSDDANGQVDAAATEQTDDGLEEDSSAIEVPLVVPVDGVIETPERDERGTGKSERDAADIAWIEPDTNGVGVDAAALLSAVANERSEETGTKRPASTASKTPPAQGRKRRHFVRFCLGTLSFVFLLALIAGLAILSLTDREIVLPKSLTGHIETRLNRELGDVHVSVGQVVVVVDDRFIPRISARNVGIIDLTGAEVMRMNTLRAALSLDGLKNAQFIPDTLQVSGAQIVVRRRADGAFAFDLGGNSSPEITASDIPHAIDAAFSEGALAKVELIGIKDVTITLEDARSQRIWQATDVEMALRNTAEKVEVSFASQVFNGTESLADFQAGFATQKGSLQTSMSLNVQNAPALDMAQQSPALSFLSVLDAPISAAMRAQVDGDARLVSYSGTLEIGAGTLAPEEGAKPLGFDGAKGYFDYDPVLERLSFPQLTLSSDVLDAMGHGHVLLSNFDGNFPGSFIGQFTLDQLSADVANMFAEPVEFESGSVDLQVDLEPFNVKVGQFSLKKDDYWLRSKGTASATEEGWTVAFDSHIEALTAQDLMALWPAQAIPKTRDWMIKNITQAQYRDVNVALRLSPEDAKPKVHLGWTFEHADVRFIKTLPPITGGAGYGLIADNALTVVVQEGHVEAPSGGQIDPAQTVVRIPDLSAKPAVLEVDLKTQSDVESALSLMAEKPFSVLKNAAFGPDVAEGTAVLSGLLSVPLKSKIVLPDVSFDITGALTDLSSSHLMAGKTILSDDMTLKVTSAGVDIEGPVTVDGAKAYTRWSKVFGSENAGKSDISGHITLDQTLLDAFEIALPRGTISGAAQGTLDVALRKGEDPAFSITSKLDGLGLSLPALGFTKGKSRAGQFEIAGRAGDAPSVSNMSIEAAGLTATGGSVTLASSGGLEQLAFQRLQVGGWLDAPVSLLGQGRGAPVKIRLDGGWLNLGKSPLGTKASGASGAASSSNPLDVILDRLVITDSLSLHGVSASLSQSGGLSGQFQGRLNGSALVSGAVSPGEFGPTINLTAQDAGQTIVAAGLLEEATGGDLAMTLTSRAEARSFDGAVQANNVRILSAPELAELLSLVSVVGLLEQLSGSGILFSRLQSQFAIHPDRIDIVSSSAEGSSLGITGEGRYDIGSETLDIEGVISPIYFLNAVGQVVSKKGEGLFGFNFDLTGPVGDPKVSVNPLSIFTPGALRGIFRNSNARTKTETDTPTESE